MTEDELIILHEDNHIIVVIKPQNVGCCPDESKDDNLLDCVKRYIKVKYNKPGEAFVGLVHRLDRPTGGVMVFAKTSKAASRLCDALKNGGFEKHYLAVLCGCPKSDEGTLENYVRTNSINNNTYVCTQTETGAKLARLEYRIKGKTDKYSLADINLLTGRKHQIRVQFAAANAPLYGDMRYGGDRPVKGKLALFAYFLRFDHPVTGEKLCFMAEPPLDETPWNMFDIKIN